MGVIWSANSFDYYMINFFAASTKGNPLYNSLSFAFFELLGYFIAIPLSKYSSLKSLIFATNMFSAVAALLYILLPSTSSIFLDALFIGLTRFGMSASFNLIYVTTNYIFDTTIVATCFAAVNMTARLVSLGASEAARLDSTYSCLIIVASSLAAALVSLALKYK